MAEVAKKNVKAKSAVVAKKPRAHPPYLQMINEAISSLKERTGSSQYAIAKFIEENQKDLPPNFKKMLLVQLRKLVAAGKLTKVKNSFKLSAPVKSAVAPAKKPTVTATTEKKRKAATAVEKKPKKVVATKKAAKTEKVTSPGKKVKAAAAAMKVKTPVKRVKNVSVKKVKKTPVKKVKSIKSPAKKAASKKGKK